MGPLEIVDASSSVIEFKWRPPKDSGGCKIGNYILERQQIGRNTWKKVGPIGPEPVYRDTNVDHGRRYCYRIRAETEMGSSEMMETEDIQAGTKGKQKTGVIHKENWLKGYIGTFNFSYFLNSLLSRCPKGKKKTFKLTPYRIASVFIRALKLL